MRYKLFIFIILVLFGGYLVYPASLDFILGKPDWEKEVTSGNKFLVKFDNTFGKFEDRKYSGDRVSDPMGEIAGGENYIIQYFLESGFITTGLNQETGRVDTFPCYKQKEVRVNNICLANQIFEFKQNGEVSHLDWGVVGHLNKVGLIDTIRKKIGVFGARWVKIEGDYADSNCYLYCVKLGKRCATNGCPAGPPPCQIEGGMAQVEMNGKPVCKSTWERDCRVLIDKLTSERNFYCCCQ